MPQMTHLNGIGWWAFVVRCGRWYWWWHWRWFRWSANAIFWCYRWWWWCGHWSRCDDWCFVIFNIDDGILIVLFVLLITFNWHWAYANEAEWERKEGRLAFKFRYWHRIVPANDIKALHRKYGDYESMAIRKSQFESMRWWRVVDAWTEYIDF